MEESKASLDEAAKEKYPRGNFHLISGYIVDINEYLQKAMIVGAEWQKNQEPALPLDLDEAWPTKDVLSKLIWASEYLLHKKSYDGHNHEEINICVKRAKNILELLNESSTPLQETKERFDKERNKIIGQFHYNHENQKETYTSFLPEEAKENQDKQVELPNDYNALSEQSK